MLVSGLKLDNFKEKEREKETKNKNRTKKVLQANYSSKKIQLNLIKYRNFGLIGKSLTYLINMTLT